MSTALSILVIAVLLLAIAALSFVAVQYVIDRAFDARIRVFDPPQAADTIEHRTRITGAGVTIQSGDDQ